MDIQSKSGYWSIITPNKLSKKDRHHNWVFAFYYETISKRNDNSEYRAFLFRNDDRTIFGLKEFRGWERVDFPKMAARVVQEKEYRESFISSDPDLPKIWKRR